MSGTFHVPLLGSLAREAWFAQMGEPAATKCLTLMLQTEPRLHRSTLAWLGGVTGVGLSSVTRFAAELVLGDGARPDIEGLDDHGRPLLVIEAKFGADLTEGQLLSYLLDQQTRLQGDAGVLVVLVPDARLDYANSVLDSAQAARNTDTIVAVAVTWDAWMDNWDEVLASGDAADFDLRSDLNQLRGLVRTMGGLLGVPYAPNPSAQWREWKSELEELVSTFTIEVNDDGGHSARDLPLQTRDPAFVFRYARATSRPGEKVFLLVGLSSARADEGKGPIWAQIGQRNAGPVIGTLRSSFPEGEEDAHGNFWIPLELPPTVGRERVRFMADSLRSVQERLAAVY